jgi:uncharacterized protein (DUF433 family)
VTGPQAKELFALMRETGKDPKEIVASDPRFQQMAGNETAAMVAAVVDENPDAVEKYLGGKENLLGFFVGQVMKRSKGKADPAEVTEMTKKELLSRISIDPNICFGKPCIRGHRIWVSLILDFLASGMTAQEILREYPGLEEADILACIAYGAEMARERYFEIPVGNEL